MIIARHNSQRQLNLHVRAALLPRADRAVWFACALISDLLWAWPSGRVPDSALTMFIQECAGSAGADVDECMAWFGFLRRRRGPGYAPVDSDEPVIPPSTPRIFHAVGEWEAAR